MEEKKFKKNKIKIKRLNLTICKYNSYDKLQTQSVLEKKRETYKSSLLNYFQFFSKYNCVSAFLIIYTFKRLNIQHKISQRNL